MRIFIAEIIKRECDAGEQVCGRADRFGAFGEESHHFFWGLQMPFGIGEQAFACMLDSCAFADTGDDIVNGAVLGRRIERVVGGEQGDAGLEAELLQPRQVPCISATTRHCCGEPDCARACLPQRLQQGFIGFRGDQQQVFGMTQQVVQPQDAIALLRAPVAQRQQPR